MIAHKELSLDQLCELAASRLQRMYATYLHATPSSHLKAAMEYTLFNGGKHLRPLLIYATGCLFNAPFDNMDIPATAVELIHTYSLIHDDLPCMDNADLRRGQPTCHIAFGEGMAVLAGDALHTLSMHIIAQHQAPLTTEKRLQMIGVLSQACGPYGMAAGQALDITMMTNHHLTTELLLNIYRLKTGALLSACIELGRLCSPDETEINQQQLKTFGNHIGLAFQIQDDIFDIEANVALLGKPKGLDSQHQKNTYPAMHGLQAAKDKVQELYKSAFASIDYLGSRAQLLRELTELMLQRKK